MVLAYPRLLGHHTRPWTISMIRISVALAALAVTLVAAGPPDIQKPPVVPGAYIVEYQDGHVRDLLYPP